MTCSHCLSLFPVLFLLVWLSFSSSGTNIVHYIENLQAERGLISCFAALIKSIGTARRNNWLMSVVLMRYFLCILLSTFFILMLFVNLFIVPKVCS